MVDGPRNTLDVGVTADAVRDATARLCDLLINIPSARIADARDALRAALDAGSAEPRRCTCPSDHFVGHLDGCPRIAVPAPRADEREALATRKWAFRACLEAAISPDTPLYLRDGLRAAAALLRAPAMERENHLRDLEGIRAALSDVIPDDVDHAPDDWGRVYAMVNDCIARVSRLAPRGEEAPDDR